MLPSREALARIANDVATKSRYGARAPRLSADSARCDVVSWLQWCDPNGSHIDDAALADRCEPYTEARAWEAIAAMLAGEV